MQNCTSRKGGQVEALLKIMFFRLNQKDCTLSWMNFKKTWFSTYVQFCFHWWNIIGIGTVFLIRAGASLKKKKKKTVSGVRGVGGSWMYWCWVCRRTTCVWEERGYCRLPLFRSAEIDWWNAHSGAKITIAIILQPLCLCPLLCLTSFSGKNNAQSNAVSRNLDVLWLCKNSLLEVNEAGRKEKGKDCQLWVEI